jgi:ankyrin repeat protein
MDARVRYLTSAVAWLLLTAMAAGAGRDLRLVSAAKRRDTPTVARLVKEKVDVNTPQADGATALHWAAHFDDLATADLLIAAGANVNATEDGGMVPLNLAALNGSAPMVERLLRAGANPNAGREPAVMTAARTGSAEAMKQLLAFGGNPNGQEGLRGQTPLMWAAAEKHSTLVRLLIEAGADVHARTRTPKPPPGSRATGGGGGVGMATAGANGFTALLFAARVGDLESVRALLDAGANVNDTAADGVSALVLATVRGYPSVARLLLERGADPNADGSGFTALHWASGSWETELTVTSITPTRDGEWSTVGGLTEGRLELVEALLTHGANPNSRIRRTPARVGSSKNPGLPELEGATPFLVAATAGATDVMRALLAGGADPRLRTRHNGTAMMAAAGLGRVIGEVLVPEAANLAAARLVLELGAADLDAVDSVGNTALHYAAYFRRDSIVELLAASGARLDVPNVFGETPLWVAELVVQFAGGGRYEMAPSSTGELLRRRGVKATRPPYKLRSRYWPDIPHI